MGDEETFSSSKKVQSKASRIPTHHGKDGPLQSKEKEDTMRKHLPASIKETRPILIASDPPVTEAEIDWELQKYKRAKQKSGQIIPQNARKVCRLMREIRKKRQAEQRFVSGSKNYSANK